MLGCGSNVGHVYERGGTTLVGELTGVTSLTYRRVRDDVSTATWTMQTEQCCALLSRIGTIRNELHVHRDASRVWRGVITRIEWGRDESIVHAQDMLWPTSRMALQVGLDFRYPNIGTVGREARAMLLEGYAREGDPWHMTSNVHWMLGPDEPRTSLVIPAYSATLWDVLDRWAENGGLDYTVVDDHVYVFDTNLAWLTNPVLGPEDLGGWPDVVEYGNEAFTRALTTNNSGQVGIATAPEWYWQYGILDSVSNDKAEADGEAPVPEEVVVWEEISKGFLEGSAPPPVRVRIPEGTALLPSAPWSFDMLVPGAWFEMDMTGLGMCRDVRDMHKIDSVTVTETVDQGEVITMTAGEAPGRMVLPR